MLTFYIRLSLLMQVYNFEFPQRHAEKEMRDCPQCPPQVPHALITFA